MVLSRPVGNSVLAAIELARPRGKDLGISCAARPGLYVRQALLVVQHVQHRQLYRHPTTSLPCRWTQDSRSLYTASRASSRIIGSIRCLSPLSLLGSYRGYRLEPLDLGLRALSRRNPAAHAHACLPSAPRL